LFADAWGMLDDHDPEAAAPFGSWSQLALAVAH
jgi:hypothetical protein